MVRQPSAIRHTLRQAVDHDLAAAQAALDNIAERPSDAIHDFRVALKRWRALLQLLHAPIGDEVVALRGQARLLSRHFGSSRDAQAALDALTDIANSGEVDTASISGQPQAIITDRLREMQKASERAALDATAIQRLRDSLVQAAICAGAWPLEDIPREEIVAGLTHSYRRARRRLCDDWSKMSPDVIHRLRKAVVTLLHQLQLVQPKPHDGWHGFIAALQELRRQLGKSNDLVILCRLTQPKQPLAAWGPHLTSLIDGQRQRHLDRSRPLAGVVLAESPRSFQRRLEIGCGVASTGTPAKSGGAEAGTAELE